MTQRQRWTRVLAGVICFGAVMDTFGAVVASRAIERSFHASPWAMRWVLSAYLLPVALLLPVGTRLGDRFGHRRMLVAGLGGLASAAAVGAWAPNVGVLIAARATAGAGAAAAFSGALGLADPAEAGPGAGPGTYLDDDFASDFGDLADTGFVDAGFIDPVFAEAGFSEADLLDDLDDPASVAGLADRGASEATVTVTAAATKTVNGTKPPSRRLGVTLGVVLGPALAGAAAQGPGWRWYYGGQAVLAGVLAVAARLTLAERRGRRHALDLEGCAVAAVAVVGLIWALNRSVEIGWATVEVIGALLFGCVATAFLVVWHLPLGPLHSRRFLAAVITELLFAASIFGPAYPAARDLQWVRGIDSLTIGVGLTGWVALAGWPLAIRYATGRRMMPRVCQPAGLVLHCTGLAVLAWTLRGGSYPAVQVAALVLSAVGVGLALAADTSLPGLPVKPMIGVISLVGAVAGIAVLAVTVPGFGTGTPGSYHGELASALLVATVLAAAASFASASIPGAPMPAPRAGLLGRLCLALLPACDIRSGVGSRVEDPPMDSVTGQITASALSA